VSIVNSSTRSTNTFPNCNTAAALTGFTHINLSCSTTACSTHLNAVTFVSCSPASGVSCVWCGTNPTPAACTAATSCGATACGADPNAVVLPSGSANTPPAGSTTLLATIQATAAPGQQILSVLDGQGNYTCGALASRGDTRSADVSVSGITTSASG